MAVATALLGSLWVSSENAESFGPSLALAQVDPYVGSQLCIRCHSDASGSLVSTPHGSPEFETRASHGCQSCHGPGRAHVEDPMDTARRPAVETLSVDEQRESCLGCHHETPVHDTRHAEAGASCADCHVVHDWDAGVTGASGDGRCLSCHESAQSHQDAATSAVQTISSSDASFRFRETPHSTLSCANCHTLGELSEQSWDGRAGTERCLGCHGQSHPRFFASSHARAGLNCSSCHSVHAGDHVAEDFPDGFAGRPSQKCIQCHQSAVTEFTFNEHHRLEEGAMECTSCHDPHEPSPRVRLGGFKNNQCTECHVDKLGPFVFEHGTSLVVGCTSCHASHGSPNRFMLTFQSEGDLCFGCHVQMPGFHSRFTSETMCTSCHFSIHGSNLDSAFLN